MKARIIAKNHHVSKTVTCYSINGQNIKRTEYYVNKKASKACTDVRDRIVFRAIHHVGNKWEDVYNYLDERMPQDVLDALPINKHTI